MIPKDRMAVMGAHTIDLAFGLGDGMPWPRGTIKKDMARFKKITLEAPDGKKNLLVAGNKTFVAMGSKTLPNRYMATISRKIHYPTSFGGGTFGASSIESLLKYVEENIPDLHRIFFIGGEHIWWGGLTHSSRAYVTVIRKEVEECHMLRRLVVPLGMQAMKAGLILKNEEDVEDEWNGPVRIDFSEYAVPLI